MQGALLASGNAMRGLTYLYASPNAAVAFVHACRGVVGHGKRTGFVAVLAAYAAVLIHHNDAVVSLGDCARWANRGARRQGAVHARGGHVFQVSEIVVEVEHPSPSSYAIGSVVFCAALRSAVAASDALSRIAPECVLGSGFHGFFGCNGLVTGVYKSSAGCECGEKHGPALYEGPS